MTDRTVHFPTTFSWGTSTSAYQIEGGGDNTDWWRFERSPDTVAVEECGDACDSWNRYEEGPDLLVRFGLNSFRLSIEWARIEPEPGVFSDEAIEHYRAVLQACRARSILPVVTLHHFTLPLWVADRGGFENPEIVEWLANYARRVGREFGELIGIACTINEPNIVAVMGYAIGLFPPQVQDSERFAAVNVMMRKAHVAMRDALREGPGTYPIGLPLSMQEYEALPGGEQRMASMREEMEDKYLLALEGDDYVGVQCYTKMVVGPDGLVLDSPGEKTEMGYLYWPQCVEATVRRAAELTNLPIIVTENGIGTNDDEQRIRYLGEALRGLSRVLADGIDVRGYFQWSLLDNFEWSLGYAPKFGIVSVDRTNFARTPKPSAQWYANVVKDFPASVL